MQAPAAGKMLWEIDVRDESKAPVAGTSATKGEPLGYVQTRYGMEEIIPSRSGRVVTVTAPQGKDVAKGEIVAFVE